MISPNLTQIKSSGAASTRAGPQSNPGSETFSRFARRVSGISAHPLTFALALLAVAVWAACGPFAHFSETWQLWINTSTTITTFLMVFLLQNAQMRDTRALHIKIDELLRAVQGARNDLIDVENLSEAELNRYCAEFSRMHRHLLEATQRRKQSQPSKAPAAESSDATN